jgi:uncharacterized protein YhhL (DUF1145 family)
LDVEFCLHNIKFDILNSRNIKKKIQKTKKKKRNKLKFDILNSRNIKKKIQKTKKEKRNKHINID